MPPPVILDLDDTLANLCTPLAEVLNKNATTRYHPKDWKEFNLAKLYSLSDEAFFERIVQSKILETLELEEGAQDLLAVCSRLRAPVVILTSRGYHPRAEALTWKWAAQKGIANSISEVVIVPKGQKKSACVPQVLEMFGVDYALFFLDDHIDNVKEVNEHYNVYCPLLMRRPWNANHRYPNNVTHLWQATTRLIAAYEGITQRPTDHKNIVDAYFGRRST